MGKSNSHNIMKGNVPNETVTDAVTCHPDLLCMKDLFLQLVGNAAGRQPYAVVLSETALGEKSCPAKG